MVHPEEYTHAELLTLFDSEPDDENDEQASTLGGMFSPQLQASCSSLPLNPTTSNLLECSLKSLALHDPYEADDCLQSLENEPGSNETGTKDAKPKNSTIEPIAPVDVGTGPTLGYTTAEVSGPNQQNQQAVRQNPVERNVGETFQRVTAARVDCDVAQYHPHETSNCYQYLAAQPPMNNHCEPAYHPYITSVPPPANLANSLNHIHSWNVSSQPLTHRPCLPSDKFNGRIADLEVSIPSSKNLVGLANQKQTGGIEFQTTTTCKGVEFAPLRPLSAYNYFFRTERDRLLSGQAQEESSVGRPVLLSDEQRQTLLMGHWKQDRTKKRAHRKTHGKISFSELSKLISARWKALDDVERSFYKETAAIDMKRYKREMDLYLLAKDRQILPSVDRSF